MACMLVAIHECATTAGRGAGCSGAARNSHTQVVVLASAAVRDVALRYGVRRDAHTMCARVNAPRALSILVGTYVYPHVRGWGKGEGLLVHMLPRAMCVTCHPELGGTARPM